MLITKLKTKSYKSEYHLNSSDSIYLNPWFVTGIFDAEGCFNITVTKSSSTNIGWRVQLRVIFELHIKDKNLVYMIQDFFNGIGHINTHTKKNSIRYEITKMNDLVTYIIPHFTKYSLQSTKRINFELWNSLPLSTKIFQGMFKYYVK